MLGTRYDTFDELVGYCRRVAGLDRPAVRGDLHRWRRPTPTAGWSWPTTSAWRCSSPTSCATSVEDRQLGRMYLPAEDLRRFGCADLDTRRCRADGADPLRGRARGASGSTAVCELTEVLDARSTSCVLAMTGIYRRVLERIVSEPGAGAARAGSRCPRGRRPGSRRGAWRRRGRAGARNMNGMRVIVIGGGLAGHHRGARLRPRRRRGDAARGPRPAGRRRLLVRARRPRAPTTASTCSCAAAPRTAGCSTDLEATDCVDAAATAARSRCWRLAAEPAWLHRSSLPAPLHLAGALLRYRPLSIRQRLSVARAMRRLGRIDPDVRGDRPAFVRRLAAPAATGRAARRGGVGADRAAHAQPASRRTPRWRRWPRSSRSGCSSDAAAGDIGYRAGCRCRRSTTGPPAGAWRGPGSTSGCAAALRPSGRTATALRTRSAAPPRSRPTRSSWRCRPTRAVRLVPEQAGVDAAIAR